MSARSSQVTGRVCTTGADTLTPATRPRDPHARDAVTRHASALLIAVLLMGCAAAGLPARAADTVGAPSIDAVFAAGERFDAMVRDAAQRGDMPRRADPAVAEVLDRIADLDMLSQDRFGVDDFETVLRLCGVPARIMSSYMLFGADQRIDASSSPAEIGLQLQALGTENAARFRDEMVALVPFGVRCGGVQASLIAAFFRTLPPAERTPIRIGGVRQFQTGVMNLYLGTLTMLVDGTLDAETRGPVLRELDMAATPVAEVLPLAGRLQVSAGVMSLVANDPGLWPQLETIQHAFTDADCGELCALMDAPGS